MPKHKSLMLIGLIDEAWSNRKSLLQNDLGASGKRGYGGAIRGHIFVDDVPYNR
ncbi:MAG: hypothetical protein J6K43_05840 [Lachnospiraceae bacterium]|nr:hypothetical protein [Lachnospiraceae bacterium]